MIKPRGRPLPRIKARCPRIDRPSRHSPRRQIGHSHSRRRTRLHNTNSAIRGLTTSVFCGRSSPLANSHKPVNQVMKIPGSRRFQPLRLLSRRGTHLPMMIDAHHSRNRIVDRIRRGPVVLGVPGWVVTDYRNAFRGEHVSIDAYDELIVTTANRWHAGLCCSLAVKCDAGVSQDTAIGITATWQRQLNHVTHIGFTTAHGQRPELVNGLLYTGFAIRYEWISVAITRNSKTYIVVNQHLFPAFDTAVVDRYRGISSA